MYKDFVSNEIVVDKTEDEIILGCLLGDAHLQKRGNSYRLKIAHTSKVPGYVRWKYENLQKLCKTTQPPKLISGKKGHQGLEFYLSSGTYLEKYHKWFYKPVEQDNGKIQYIKTITKETLKALPVTSIVWAIAWMDDGSVRSDAYAGRLAFQGYTLELLVGEYLLKTYGINTKIKVHKEDKGQWTLTVPAAEFQKLVDLIEPVVKQVPDMQYKLNEKRRLFAKNP